MLGAMVLLIAVVAGALVYVRIASPTNLRIASPTNLLQNPSFEDSWGTTPKCWAIGGYGSNTFTSKRVSDAHSGSFAANLVISRYSSGDRKFVGAQDSGACAPAISPGRRYTVTAWYKATRKPYFFVYYRTTAGSWIYWVQSPNLAIATAWMEARFTTPVLPAGAKNLSIGMGIDGVGSLTVDDFALFEGGVSSEPTAVPGSGGATSPTRCVASICPSKAAPSRFPAPSR
jgi:hypothetical protein